MYNLMIKHIKTKYLLCNIIKIVLNALYELPDVTFRGLKMFGIQFFTFVFYALGSLSYLRCGRNITYDLI